MCSLIACSASFLLEIVGCDNSVHETIVACETAGCDTYYVTEAPSGVNHLWIYQLDSEWAWSTEVETMEQESR